MDLSSMTLTQLQYLVAVEDSGSFRAAARSCGVSQPALSTQIRKLEGALEMTVFDRSASPPVATEAGRAVLEQARVILREAARMTLVASNGDGEPRGTYRLGVIPTLASLLVPRFLPRFVREFPQVELVLEEVQTAAMLDRLHAETLDGGLAATPLGRSGIVESTLFYEPMHAYLPAGHALLQKEYVRQRDLVKEQVWVLAEGHCFGSQTLQLCDGQQAVCGPEGGSVDFRGGSFHTLTALVDEGLGSTVLPELAVLGLAPAKRKSHVRPLARPTPHREVSMLVRRAHLRRAITEAIESCVRSSVPEPLLSAPTRGVVLDPE